MARDEQEDSGALVGWTLRKHGERLALRLQYVRSAPPHAESDVYSNYLLLDQTQAAQLGNLLFEVSGQTKPAPRRNWLGRMLMP